MFSLTDKSSASTILCTRVRRGRALGAIDAAGGEHSRESTTFEAVLTFGFAGGANLHVSTGAGVVGLSLWFADF